MPQKARRYGWWLLTVGILLACNITTQPTISQNPAATATDNLPALAQFPTLTSTRYLSPTPTTDSEVTSVPTVLIPAALPTQTPLPIIVSPRPQVEAQVAVDGDGLRLRQLPDTTSEVASTLTAFTPLIIRARTLDNQWYLVEAGGEQRGWVAASFVDVYIDLGSIPVLQSPIAAFPSKPTSAPAVSVNVSPSSADVLTNITPRAREIFLQGQSLGNRANVFSRVGDSISIATFFLYPFNWGYDLGAYSNLQSALSYFSGGSARDGNNAFGNISVAADNQWTTFSVLDSSRANPAVCQSGEAPLVCEYRIVKPSVALIMIGTNDLALLSAEQYRANLAQIVQITIDFGIIPVLSTIPQRIGFEAKRAEFNQIIRATAQTYQIPLWDYGGLMDRLPNQGLAPDGLHPSFASETDYTASTRFTASNLQYGYTLRNLSALQVLNTLWRQVLY